MLPRQKSKEFQKSFYSLKLNYSTVRGAGDSAPSTCRCYSMLVRCYAPWRWILLRCSFTKAAGLYNKYTSPRGQRERIAAATHTHKQHNQSVRRYQI